MCWTDLGTLGNWQPQFGFVSLPFLFNDYDHVKKVLYGPIGQQVGKDAKDSLGIEVLSLGASGFRVFLSKKPIQTADDVRGHASCACPRFRPGSRWRRRSAPIRHRSRRAKSTRRCRPA